MVRLSRISEDKNSSKNGKKYRDPEKTSDHCCLAALKEKL